MCYINAPTCEIFDYIHYKVEKRPKGTLRFQVSLIKN